MQEHILKNFESELEKLRQRIVKMGALVQEQIKNINRSLVSDDKDVLKSIKDTEDKIDKLDIKIDKQCMRIFALHQPVASDLRFVMSAISINDNFELIGDAALSIGYLLERTDLAPLSLKKTKIHQFSQTVEQMMADVLDAIIKNDVEKAESIIDMDDSIVELVKENYFKIVGMMSIDSTYIESGACLVDINRSLAEIASLIISIAHKVQFIVEAKLLKHRDADISDDDRMINTEKF